jgi:hypothetical protein
MHTTPSGDNVPDDTDSSNFDPCQAAEEMGYLLTRVEALAWATGQALGLPHGPEHSRERERLHVLVSLTAHVAEEALGNAEDILGQMAAHMAGEVSHDRR